MAATAERPIGLQFDKVEKRYGSVCALRNLTLSVGAGECVAVAGRNQNAFASPGEKMLALSRLYFENIENIQSSWVTQGGKIGQLALYFGANDMGSLMIEENVVASAGTVHYLTLEQIKNSIREAGYIPRQRNVFYAYIDEAPPKEASQAGTYPAAIA